MAIQFFELNDKYASVETKSFVQEFRNASKLKDAKIYFIHNPKIKNLVTTDIDLLLIIAIERKERNYFRVERKFTKDGKSVYLYNLIVPIKFEKEYESCELKLFENYPTNVGIMGEDDDIIFEENYQSIIYNLKNQTNLYLKNVFNRGLQDEQKIIKDIDCHPIIWIYSSNRGHYDFSKKHLIYAPKFGFNEFLAYLKFSSDFTYFNSVEEWSERYNENAFKMIDLHLKNLEEQIEKDNRIGFLTKRKIDHIAKLYSEDLKIYERYLTQQNKTSDVEYDFILSDSNEKNSRKEKIINLPSRIKAEKELGKNLVIINGKAGSGKTSELLLIMEKCYKGKIKTQFFTYNKLLTYEMKNILDRNQYGSGKSQIRTIHKFISDLSRKLGVSLIMSQDRVESLLYKLDKRVELVKDFIFRLDNETFEELKKDFITPVKYELNSLDKETKDFYFNFCNKYIRNRKNKEELDRNQVINFLCEQFKSEHKDEIIKKIEDEIFIFDYLNVLKELLLAINETELFWEKHNGNDMNDDIWEKIIKKRYREQNNKLIGKYYSKSIDDFTEMKNRSIGAFRKKHNNKEKVIIIDEAQDCAELERDLFFTIFGKSNMVISTGGKEQLIRYESECNWEVDSKGRKHSIIKIEKRNKTFRMKKKIVDLCNFIANKFEIKLDLECELNDDGEVIFELGKDNLNNVKKYFDIFNQKGSIQGLSPYESVLFLINGGSDELFNKDNVYEVEEFYVNKYDNLQRTKKKEGKEFILASILGFNIEEYGDEDEFPIWTHNLNQDRKNDLDDENEMSSKEEEPSQYQYRAICYESCRGLEAWSVMCFEIDEFYERKKWDDDAVKYLSDDLFLSEEERRQKYAATWVLMALTRAMDTLYIQVNDVNSEFGKILYEYYQQKES